MGENIPEQVGKRQESGRKSKNGEGGENCPPSPVAGLT